MSKSKNALLNFEEKYKLGPVNPKTGTHCWIWTACQNSGYGYFKWNGIGGYAHRFAWTMWRGEIPAGYSVDHDDPDVGCGNSLCVNPDHLALATPAQQKQRQRKLQRNNTSGVRGVLVGADGKYLPVIQHGGKKYRPSFLNLPNQYECLEEATEARAKLEIHFWGANK